MTKFTTFMMITMKDLRFIIPVGLLGVFFTSCGPIIVEPVVPQSTIPREVSSIGTQKVSVPTTQTVTSQAQKEIREQVQKVQTPATTSSITAPSLPQPVVSSYPVAMPIPGKPGYVYNPYNNNHVYVEGIPSGKTVRDPKDSNTDHVFRLP